MENKNGSNSTFGFLVRLYWMALGNFITIILAMYLIVKNLDPTATIFINIFYFLNIISLIVLRYIDIRYLNGMTTECEPATINHWKKYTVKLILFSLVLWLIINVTKYYLSLK